MLRRIAPREYAQSPLDTFSLLLVNQGFPPEEFPGRAKMAWERIAKTRPLNRFFSRGCEALSVSVYWDDGVAGTETLDLGITQNGLRLSADAGHGERLRTHLSKHAVEFQGHGYNAGDIWPRYGGIGRGGSLVAVLKRGTTPGELYELSPSVTYPTPLVGVVVAGRHWEQPLARGMAQTLAALLDEYELDGADFQTAPAALVDFLPPNVIFIDNVQRSRLAAGEHARDVISELRRRWPIYWLDPLTFYGHQGEMPNPPAERRANGDVQLVEGASGYRFNALRCDFDCLMRRRPYDAAIPIQADVGLCRACRVAVGTAIAGMSDLPYRRRIDLRSQRVLFDDVKWPSIETLEPSFPFTRPVVSPDTRSPKWSCTIEVSPTDGLTITDLKLADRPEDPFSAAEDVMSLIAFEDVAVEFEGEPSITVAIADAFRSDSGLPRPLLQLAFEGGPRKEFRIGVKLTLWVLLPDRCSLEVIMSLVLKDKANDIDPGGAALACKLYPQLSLRHGTPPTSPTTPKTLPRIRALHGTISVWANNVVPPELADGLMEVDHHLAEMASGRNAATTITDSNTGPRDAIYKLEAPLLGFPRALPFASIARWQSGRKLAGIEDVRGGATLAATAFFANFYSSLAPTLPHWSWLFDYAIPTLGGTTAFVGAYASHEKSQSGEPATSVRETTVRWPPAALQSGTAKSYQMVVKKLPRQGAYDNVHVALEMGQDHHGRPIVSAPFCCDKCIHIHWRWGTVATSGAHVAYPFLGWGDGQLNNGAHMVPGAPLIPPNQRLDVIVSKEVGNLAGVAYKVTAFDPGVDEAQVLLEQGISFAFSYGGLAYPFLGPLAAALWLIPPLPTDLSRRKFFHEVYPAIRWYDQVIDGCSTDMVQQIPGAPTDTGAIPRLEQL